ncbi:di-N-acetylchitobiase-like [Rhinophrynus dorsalis]
MRDGPARLWVLYPLLLLLEKHMCSALCPCIDPALCEAITDTKDFEVFVFHVEGKNWKSYDWSQITTIASFAQYEPELLCYAHSKGVRLVLTGDVPVKDMVDPKTRAAWIAEKIDLAKSQYMDGINLDIEQPVLKGTPEYYALTALVQETTEAFHREIPGSQVTFDTPWSPNCIALRCYNYTGIAALCDFLFVMSYDEQCQLVAEWDAGANSPYNQTITGYEQFIDLNIDPKKLVMGVPWYGYDYVCLELSKDNKCVLHKVPYGSAAGQQVQYSEIMKQLNSSFTGRLWDDQQKSPFYNYKDGQGYIHQVWYDDPQSISLKVGYVKKRGLRGVGMWHADTLDYSSDPVAHQQTEDMWKALRP